MSTRMLPCVPEDQCPAQFASAVEMPANLRLAVYLKGSYGHKFRGMQDEDWLDEAEEILEFLGIHQ